MTSDWKRRTLQELVEIKHGYAFKGEFFRDQPPGDILLTPGNFAIGGGFKGDKFKYYVGPAMEDYVLSEGDLIVTMTDLSKQGDTLGYGALVPRTRNNEGRYLHNQRLGKVLIKDETVTDRLFLNYVLRSEAYRQEVLASLTGTTVKHTSPERIKKYAFDLPPLVVQQDIGQTLFNFDRKIDNNKDLCEILLLIAGKMYQHLFVSDETATAMEPTALKELTSKIGSGSTPRGGREVYVDSGTNLIRSQNVYDNQFEWEGLVRITDSEAERMRGVTVLSEDVLINITGDSILRTCVVEEDILPARVNQHVAIVRPKEGIPSHYLHLYLLQDATKAALIGNDAGGSRAAITKGHLEDLKIPIPKPALLRQFEQLTSPLFLQISSYRKEIRKLEKMRDSLLPQLLSGSVKTTSRQKLGAGR